jgi:hypothetical protein
MSFRFSLATKTCCTMEEKEFLMFRDLWLHGRERPTMQRFYLCSCQHAKIEPWHITPVFTEFLVSQDNPTNLWCPTASEKYMLQCRHCTRTYKNRDFHFLGHEKRAWYIQRGFRAGQKQASKIQMGEWGTFLSALFWINNAYSVSHTLHWIMTCMSHILLELPIIVALSKSYNHYDSHFLTTNYVYSIQRART